MPNGELLWRAVMVGLEQSERKLEELAAHSTNELVAMHLETKEIVALIPAKEGESVLASKLARPRSFAQRLKFTGDQFGIFSSVALEPAFSCEMIFLTTRCELD